MLNSKTDEVCTSLVSGLFLFLSSSRITNTDPVSWYKCTSFMLPLRRCPTAHSGPEVYLPLVT